jgi:hypothetical protein
MWLMVQLALDTVGGPGRLALALNSNPFPFLEERGWEEPTPTSSLVGATALAAGLRLGSTARAHVGLAPLAAAVARGLAMAVGLRVLTACRQVALAHAASYGLGPALALAALAAATAVVVGALGIRALSFSALRGVLEASVLKPSRLTRLSLVARGLRACTATLLAALGAGLLLGLALPSPAVGGQSW